MNKYTSYEIESTLQIGTDIDKVSVFRRYSQFRWLHKHLCWLPGVFLPAFPSKELLNKTAETVVEERKAKLEVYLTFALALPPFVHKNFLTPFLTLDPAAFDAFRAKTPCVNNPLPVNPSSLWSYFATSSPKVQLEAFARYAETAVDFEHAALRAELGMIGETAGSSTKGFESLGELVKDLSGRYGELVDELQAVAARSEEVAENELFEGTQKVLDGAKTDDFSKLFVELTRILQTLAKLHEDVGEQTDELKDAVESFTHGFQEVLRLVRQQRKFEEFKTQSEILANEFKSKSIGDKNKSSKAKAEGLCAQLKEFKQLMTKMLKLFDLNFTVAFGVFLETRKMALQEIVKAQIDGHRMALASAIVAFDKAVEV